MFPRESNNSESSSNDGTFDFNYKMDLSGRKGRTGDNFNPQDGFDFNDFNDFGENRTQKSQKSEFNSQKKWIPSDINKKSEEGSFMGMDEISKKKRNASFLGSESGGKNNDTKGEGLFTSPKFNMQSKSYRTIPLGIGIDAENQTSKLSEVFQPSQINKNKDNRHYSGFHPTLQIDSNPYQPKMHPHFSEKVSPTYSPSLPSPGKNYHTPVPPKVTPQDEYKHIQSSIQFYQKCNDELDYETFKLMKEIEEYQALLHQNSRNQYEMERYISETSNINSSINEEKSIERKLVETYATLEQEYDQVVSGVKEMKFSRPAVIKDEVKVMIEEINSLKGEFESLRRDEGSLNLSVTLENPNGMNSIENRFSFNTSPMKATSESPEDMIFRQYVREMNEYDRQIPNYLRNIKMLTIKEEWKLFQNSEICVNCSYRDYPDLKIVIGNKTIKNLTNFFLKEGTLVIAEKDVLLSKSYYVHTHRLIKFSQPFLKLQLKYSVGDGQSLGYTGRSESNQNLPLESNREKDIKSFAFFIPSFTLKHGEFIPMTRKEYDHECSIMKDSLETSKNLERPMDRNIVKNSIRQLTMYYPNLIYEEGEQDGSCRGLFQVWDSTEGALVKIKQSGDLIRITIRGNIPFLIKGLEFLLTSMM